MSLPALSGNSSERVMDETQIQVPGSGDLLETWEAFLRELEGLPADRPLRAQLIRRTRSIVASLRRNEERAKHRPIYALTFREGRAPRTARILIWKADPIPLQTVEGGRGVPAARVPDRGYQPESAASHRRACPQLYGVVQKYHRRLRTTVTKSWA